MAWKTWIVSLLAGAASVGAVSPPLAAPIIPGRYIVEFKDGQDGGAFIDSIAHEADKKMDLNYKLFKGASIKFHDAEKSVETAAKVASMPAVKAIWPVRRYSIPEYTLHWAGGAEAAVGMTKRQAPNNQNDTFSTHIMTQVDKLKAEGYFGDGIKIAVIDTGVDYKHPDLGGCFGPGCLVSFGTDLVGDQFNGKNTPVPDPDPYDGCNGHGTHVAGIIAAQGNNQFGVLGAAPGVTLGSYRVFGCNGDVPNDVLIAAYNQAFEAGADIITASIGGPSGWSEDPWAVVVSRIVDQGVPCTTSAGNSGATGMFFASTASNGKGVTSVASVDNTKAPILYTNGTYTIDGGDEMSFGYTPGTPGDWKNVSLPLWAVNFNTTDAANGCDPYPADTPDLSGHVVLVRRGTCTFVQKASNAAAHGAKYVMFYNNVPGTIAADAAGTKGITAIGMVTGEQGESWIKQLAAGTKVVISTTDPMTAPKTLVNRDNFMTPGYLSTFTSWGPTNEAEIKPQFSAPGGLILSTYPLPLGGYAVVSGTSMACPMTAAIYALIMNVRKTKDPRVIESVLSATANPNIFHNGLSPSRFLAPVPQQGAGLIQAHDAAHATSLLSVSSLAFNDTDNHIPMQNFTISNTGRTSIVYKLSNVLAATAYTFANDSTIFPDTFPNDMVTSGATVAFGPSESVTIPAGQRRVISVSPTPPADVDPKRLAVYSGYIAINGSDGSSLSLPYMGVVGSLHKATVLDPSNTYLSDSRARGPGGSATDRPPRAAGNATFVLPPPGHANDTGYANASLPQINVNLAMGSPLVRVDVVPVLLCRNASMARDALGIPSLGQPPEYPVEYASRGSFSTTWDGKLGGGDVGAGGKEKEGVYAPPGTYKFVVRALHIFGDKGEAAEYDVAETVPFRIRYVNAGKPARRGTRAR